ncbi:hypothetical protein JXA80_01595 [bacterium]|nr:hypothetical protein [candidate division CSSED10-310 bacterium]
MQPKPQPYPSKPYRPQLSKNLCRDETQRHFHYTYTAPIEQVPLAFDILAIATSSEITRCGPTYEASDGLDIKQPFERCLTRITASDL